MRYALVMKYFQLLGYSDSPFLQCFYCVVGIVVLISRRIVLIFPALLSEYKA